MVRYIRCISLCWILCLFLFLIQYLERETRMKFLYSSKVKHLTQGPCFTPQSVFAYKFEFGDIIKINENSFGIPTFLFLGSQRPLVVQFTNSWIWFINVYFKKLSLLKDWSRLIGVNSDSVRCQQWLSDVTAWPLSHDSVISVMPNYA